MDTTPPPHPQTQHKIAVQCFVFHLSFANVNMWYLVNITQSDWSAHVTPTNEKTGSAETEGQLVLESDSDLHTTQMSDVEVGVPE